MAAWKRLQRHGLMPVAGGWLDQAEQYLAAMDLIDSEVAEIQAANNG